MELNCVEKFSVKPNLQIVTFSLVENLPWIVCWKIFREKNVQDRNQAFRGKYAGVLSVGKKTNNLLKTSVQHQFSLIAGLGLAVFVSVEYNQVITSLSFKEIS